MRGRPASAWSAEEVCGWIEGLGIDPPAAWRSARIDGAALFALDASQLEAIVRAVCR